MRGVAIMSPDINLTLQADFINCCYFLMSFDEPKDAVDTIFLRSNGLTADSAPQDGGWKISSL